MSSARLAVRAAEDLFEAFSVAAGNNVTRHNLGNRFDLQHIVFATAVTMCLDFLAKQPESEGGGYAAHELLAQMLEKRLADHRGPQMKIIFPQGVARQ